jgi:hypothetical protein
MDPNAYDGAVAGHDATHVRSLVALQATEHRICAVNQSKARCMLFPLTEHASPLWSIAQPANEGVAPWHRTAEYPHSLGMGMVTSTSHLFRQQP